MGISEDGGLFVPQNFPKLDLNKVLQLNKQGYEQLSAYVLSMFFEETDGDLLSLTKSAYKSFDAKSVVPTVKLTEQNYVMELYHGPTLAFKDMALQILPRLTSLFLKEHQQEEKVLVLTATSGDTGKAALEGFANVENTAIVVYFPVEGVSDIQKLQMVTQEGENTSVCGVYGNFDDAQTGVKALFADKQFVEYVKQKGYTLSSANSINFGRLIPQVAYYINTYADLVNQGKIKLGEEINFCVPTGNFGNILAGYYAKCMGLPVKKLICASNNNNVLTEFFANSEYNANREFFQTMSPSMDILISSNLERLIFEICNRNSNMVKDFMEQLNHHKKYTITAEMKEKLNCFYAECCNEEETKATIKNTFEMHGYLMDTHTAVAQCVYEKYQKQTRDTTLTVVVSTANPYKFAGDVLCALSGEVEADAFVAVSKLNTLSKVRVPQAIIELNTKAVAHKDCVNKNNLKKAVEDFLEK